MKQITTKKIFMWLILSINLLFAFLIGLSIPLMESVNSQNFGFVMIPLMIILNYVIIDRFHYHVKHSGNSEEKNKIENANEGE